MADDKPFHHHTSGKGDKKCRRYRDYNRQGVVRHEKLHDIACVGTHHDELAMRHIDDPHHAKRDGKADGRQKIDGGEAERIYQKIDIFIQGDLCLNGVQNIPRRICDQR